jgi:hypothetical protein
MPKLYIKKRVKFPSKAAQKKFFRMIVKAMSGNIKEIAQISKVGVRQISDFRNAKSTLSLYAFEKLLAITKIPRPNSIEIIDRYSHTKLAGKKGFAVVMKKYGKFPKNEKLRRKNGKDGGKPLVCFKKGKYSKGYLYE